MKTRTEKAWEVAQMIYWAVEHGDKAKAERLLDKWAEPDRRQPEWLSEALNSGDGTYKP